MKEFETYLTHVLDNLIASPVKEAMQYSLTAGGKRIRPQLLLAALAGYGMDKTCGYPAAAAVEMIHTYSLIHDDLPAMDNDTLRRGKPTCHVQYGEAFAILAGDALLTQAFALGATTSKDPNTNCAIVGALAQYAGTDGMVLGQSKDLEGEGNADLTLEELKAIHYYKTGRLLTLPLILAAYIAHKEEDIDTWIKIGQDIGLSFQIQDDILDVTSTTEELGKNINSDADNEKRTYVAIAGMEQAKQDAQFYYQRAQQELSTLAVDAIELNAIFTALMQRKN